MLKKFFLRRFNLFWSISILCFFEFIILSMFRGSFLFYNYDSSHQQYFLYVLVLLLSILPLFLFLNRNNTRRDDYLSLIPLSLINLNIFFFINISGDFLINQLFCALSFIATISFSNDILGDRRRIHFTNIASFFIFFLVCLNSYFAVYNLEIPYILVFLVFAVFSTLLMLYKIISTSLERGYLVVVLSLFALIITELFVFSFFWPIGSFLIKSLAMVFVYYLYWGMVGLYIENKIKKQSILQYTAVLLSLAILLIAYLFLKMGG